MSYLMSITTNCTMLQCCPVLLLHPLHPLGRGRSKSLAQISPITAARMATCGKLVGFSF